MMLHTAGATAAFIEALPVVKTIQDCADYTKVVEPFLTSQLHVSDGFLTKISSSNYLLHLYLSTNPFVTGLAIALLLIPVFLVVSEVNQNYSQVDRMWSLLPTMYNAHFAIWAHLSGLETGKVNTILAFSMMWTTRLTYNYWRKGGYSIGSEDYRWEIVRNKTGRFVMFLFNIIFISSIQSVLLFMLTAPTYVIMLSAQLTDGKMDLIDMLFSRGLMSLVLFEWFADQQQWNYQQAKKQYHQTAKVPSTYKHSRADLDRGFVTTGLWSLSRHPNFFAEQTIWTVLYAWSCYLTKTYFHWAGLGAASLIALFAGSTWLTEKISAKKYPEYREYQRRVPMFVPNPFAARLSGPADSSLNDVDRSKNGSKKVR